jgi:hypothetical protein
MIVMNKLLAFFMLGFLTFNSFSQKLEMDASLMEMIYCDNNVEYKFSGKNDMRPMPFVGKIIKNIDFPADSKEMIIEFNPMVVPDAFYVKYGDQEFFSGFMGDVYNLEYRQVALSIEERKKMFPIQGTQVKESIKESLADGDNDYSQMENIVRNFIGELIIYKRTEGLLESINAAIKSEGGKLILTDIFKNGDAEAEKITSDLISSGSMKDNLPKYKTLGIKNSESLTLTKKQGNDGITIIVFSPLDRTMFKMNLTCK